jgi:hypothetical protein
MEVESPCFPIDDKPQKSEGEACRNKEVEELGYTEFQESYSTSSSDLFLREIHGRVREIEAYIFQVSTPSTPSPPLPLLQIPYVFTRLPKRWKRSYYLTMLENAPYCYPTSSN